MSADHLKAIFRVLVALFVVLTGIAAYIGVSAFQQGQRDREAEALRDAFDIRDYIEVTAVKVHDTIEGHPIEMDVARILKRNFPGAYRVTIRQADGGTAVCSTGLIEWDYAALDQNGEPTQLPDPLLLSWWAWGGSCTDIQRRGLPPGQYTAETCHFHRSPPGYSEPVGMCWRPVALFTIFPAT